MNMKQSCKALICAIEGELDGRHCTEEQAAAILDHVLPSMTEALVKQEKELKYERQIQAAMATDQKTVADALDIPPGKYSGGAGEQLLAIARLRKERDAAQAQLAQLQAEMPALRANMTKALDLLQVLTSTKYTDRVFVEAVDVADEMLEQLRGKVVLEGLAEQQEAQSAAHGDEARGTVRVTAAWLKKVHRDLDACQNVIWLAGCRPRVSGGFDPAYCEDAQERLKEIDEQIARADAAGGAQHA